MSQRILIEIPDGPYWAERCYILEVLIGEFLGLSYDVSVANRPDTRLSLAEAPGSPALTVADGLFGQPPSRWLTPASLPRLPLSSFDGRRLPGSCRLTAPDVQVLYGTPSLERVGEAGWQLGLDVFGGAFFLLARYEELALEAEDAHDRFPAAASLACREGFLERPLANEYLEILWTLLKDLWPQLERSPRRFRLLVSHDVDMPIGAVGWPWPQVVRASVGDLFKRRDPVLASRRLRAVGRAPAAADYDADPYNTFDFMMDVSEEIGVTSAFNFIPDHSAGALDGRYSLCDPWIQTLMRRIHDRGHELGFHPSYHTYRDAARTRREFEALTHFAERAGVHQAQWGGRQHFLRWRNPMTWQNWSDAGLAYDSSLGFADRPGFRAGCCYAYPAYNLLTRQRLPLVERPLVMMDQTLFKYMRLPLAEAGPIARRLAATCRVFEGDFTLLWHNSMLIAEAQRRCYAAILAELAGAPALLASAGGKEAPCYVS